MLDRVLAIDGIEAIVAIGFWKLATFLVIYVAWSLLPFDHQLRNVNLRYGVPFDGSLSAALSTWDAQHYILLAERGYSHAPSLSNAFGPLYPLTIRAVNLVTGDSIASGLLISNVASGLALYLLYRFVKRRWSATAAFTTLLLFVAFPTAFYFNLIYTEALFLLLSVGFFVALYERRLAVAAACAFLLPLLRVPGLVVLAPFVWVLLADALPDAGTVTSRLARLKGFRPTPRLLWALAPLAGFGVYLLYMHSATGDAFIAMHTEKLYISNRSIDNLVHPWRLIGDLFDSKLVMHNYLDSALDRAFFVVFVASLPLVYKRVDMPLFLFCAIIGLQPFLGSFMSYMRLMVVAFPLFIAYGSMLEKRSPHLLYGLVYPLAMLQALLLSLHVLSYWVA